MYIAIYETVHFENIVPLLRLFSLPGNQVTVFCDTAAFEQVKALLGDEADNSRWFLQSPDESRRSYISRVKEILEKEPVDLLYINTLSDNFFHLKQLVQSKGTKRTVATLHVLNGYFSPRLKFNLRRIVRVVGKWMLRRTIQEYVVQSTSMFPAARKLVDPRFPVHCIPGAVYDASNAEIEPTLPLHLVVAGSVDPRRRDYEEVDSLILYLEKLQLPVRITILGATDSPFGNDKCRKWSKQNLQYVQLKWYETGTVPQEEYDRVIAAAHFIFHPSTLAAVLEDGALEKYGKTVCSGVFSDSIRHAKPLILPATLSADPSFERCSFRYSGIQEIAALLQKLTASPSELKRWHVAGIEMAKQFTVEKIRQRNPSLFKADAAS